MVLPSSQIKTGGNSVNGFMSYDRTYQQHTEIYIYIFITQWISTTCYIRISPELYTGHLKHFLFSIKTI